jgi:NADH dehydrogenase
MTNTETPVVLVLGGGFAGLWATRALAAAPVRVVLLDRTNHHLFQPLLYQVATAGLSAPDIAAPLRHILRRQRNATVLLGDAEAVLPATREVRLVGRRTPALRLSRRRDRRDARLFRARRLGAACAPA